MFEYYVPRKFSILILVTFRDPFFSVVFAVLRLNGSKFKRFVFFFGSCSVEELLLGLEDLIFSTFVLSCHYLNVFADFVFIWLFLLFSLLLLLRI